MMRLVKEARKFLVAVIGVAGNLVAIGVVPAADVRWVTLGITVATACGVYVVPNQPPTKSPTT